MRRSWFWSWIAVAVLASGMGTIVYPADNSRPERHRSPVDLVILGGQRALTANATADSVSLVDLAGGRVLAEQACGRRPSAVACARNGDRAAVSNLWDGTLTLLELRGDTLRTLATLAIGDQPRGLVFNPAGDRLYAALGGADEIVELDWRKRQVARRWPAPREPRRLALTRDGRFLIAASTRPAQVRCWDTRSGRPVWERTILDAFNLHGLALSPNDQEMVTTHVHDRHHPIAKNNIEQGWALDNRLTRLTVAPTNGTDYWQIALDTRGRGVADPAAAAFSVNGEWLAVAAAGTHELLLFQAKAVPWCSGDPGDFLEPGLNLDNGKLRHVPVGGRPVAVQFRESAEAVVANFLLDAVQIVDVKTGKLARQIPLGGPAQPGLARRGAAIFYDAQRSHHQWFSCHTCHPDGHTSGRLFDTLNDESYSNPKLTPTLRGVSRTGPWTWHGWQTDLGEAIDKSLRETLFGPKPSRDEIQAVRAFLDTLDHPPNPYRRPDGTLEPAARRGEAIFRGKGRCARCHQGDQYTSTKNYDVQLEADGSPFDLWNPPSLRGVYERGPYLHDGRAESLDELLRYHHAPEKLGGAALTPEERRDLVAFLRWL
jgi:cytochrome c peroxidase